MKKEQQREHKILLFFDLNRSYRTSYVFHLVQIFIKVKQDATRLNGRLSTAGDLLFP